MKSFQTKTAVAFLIVAGGIVPAFGQSHGNGERGGDRRGGGQRRSDHSAQRAQRGQMREQQVRSQQQARPQAAPLQRGNFRSGGNQFQRGNQNDRRPFQGGQPRQFQSEQRQPEVRQQNNFRGGNSFQQFGTHNWNSDHRNWSQRGGYHGYLIPQNRFYSSFGPRNYFRIGQPVFYDGVPRFQYGGYSFLMMDPWPDYWGADWYDSDDVYVDYQNDGYYMYNRRYPGVGLALNIEF
ncbi:MAG TPA: hypothetical protein VN519_06300 [Bryobacteraceae bacterium]|nr:hypothetical protein [Bryobacteraceae bacterium]